MFRIHVERTIPRPVDEVFAILTDHASYGRFPGVSHAELLEPGLPDRNGVGALREVHLGQVRFHERITAYQHNARLSYRIERSRPMPMAHQGGTLAFTAVDAQTTRVVWTSEGTTPIPLLGRLVDALMERQATHGFGAVLKAVERL